MTYVPDKVVFYAIIATRWVFCQGSVTAYDLTVSLILMGDLVRVYRLCFVSGRVRAHADVKRVLNVPPSIVDEVLGVIGLPHALLHFKVPLREGCTPNLVEISLGIARVVFVEVFEIVSPLPH